MLEPGETFALRQLVKVAVLEVALVCHSQLSDGSGLLPMRGSEGR